MFSSYQTSWFAAGAIFGSAMIITFNNPFVAFQIGGTVGLIITIGGCLLSDEMETNKYAQMAIDLEQAIFLDQESTKNHQLSKSMVSKKKNCC